MREPESWYRRAAEAGHVDAMTNLGAMLERRGEDGGAEEWYRRGAEAADPVAMRSLASMLERRRALDEADEWYQRADPEGRPRRRQVRRRNHS